MHNRNKYFVSPQRSIYSADSRYRECLLLRLDPGAGTEDLIQVQGHAAFLNQTLNLLLVGLGEDPHQGLGGEPVLCSLLVISLGHVIEHEMSGLVDVVDDLSEVTLEVLSGESFKV